MVIGRMLCGKLMKWMDFWQVKEFIKDVELIKRTREILVDDNITKDYDKLMITDAFRLHFLKYNKLWLIKNLKIVCNKNQFFKNDFYLLKLYSDLGDIQ